MTAALMGLHTKAVEVDGKRVFIGSMNIDPRPWRMNGEMGVDVEGTGLAADLQFAGILDSARWESMLRLDRTV